MFHFGINWVIAETFWKIIIGMVAGIYKMVNYAFQVFLVLAKTNIFSQTDYEKLTAKVYVILGIVIMFVIAYNFLTLIVDPDKNKDGTTIEKMLKTMVTSFILIVLCPTLFSMAFDVQNAIITQGTITNFFGNTGLSGSQMNNDTIKKGGYQMATYTFAAFFVPEDGYDSTIQSRSKCSKYVNTFSGKCTLDEALKYAEETGKFSVFKAFNDNIDEDEIDFHWLLALVAGGFLVYVIVSFCFDLAIRVIKLAFYQIIAPICIACRILPDKDSIFKNWWKAVSKTYFSVFVRIFIMNLGVYLISIFVSHQDTFFTNVCDVSKGECSAGVRLFAYAFIIMGIVAFMRQASKLIDEIFGLGDISLGIKDKLKEGGAFTAGAALGSAVTSGVRNFGRGVQNTVKAVKNTDGTRGQKVRAGLAAGIKGIGSGFAGTAAGLYRGGRNGWTAGSFKDMANAATTGAKETTDARDKRAAYRASHQLGKLKGTMPFIGGIATAAGHAVDAAKDVARWAGFNNIEELKAENQAVGNVKDKVASSVDAAKNLIMSKYASKKWKLGLTDKDISSQSTLNTVAGGDKNHIKVSKDVAYSLENFKKIQHAIEESKRTGGKVKVDILSDTYEFTAEELGDISGKYLSDFSKKVADVGFKSDGNFESTFKDADGKLTVSNEEWGEMKEIHTKCKDARFAIQNMVGSDAITVANNAAITVNVNKKLKADLSSDSLSPQDRIDIVLNDSGEIDYAKSNLTDDQIEKVKAAREAILKDNKFMATIQLIDNDTLKKDRDLKISDDSAVDKVQSTFKEIIENNQDKINQMQQDEKVKKGEK